jgi:ABC-type antimicrobial peptide transport system permease subunit
MVGPGYVKTTGLELKEGREFLETDRADSIQNVKTVLITESLAKLMGKGSALGKKIMAQRGEAPNNEVSATVVGVVKDFVYGNMYRKSDPVIFFYYPKNANNIYVRTKPGYTAQQVISKFAEVVNRHNPAYPFEYEFVSDQFNNLFSGETLVSKLSRIFAILAIFICCLGLFGLAAHTAEQRFKEIGIRKVLGASSVRVVRLLSYDFLKLVLFSCIIAFPAALWAMNSWLEQYAYRIKIGPLVFLFAGAIAMIIAFITISFQTIRAAAANPVNTLRTE